jgi:purine-nucleoside phosphorylase
LKAIGLQPRLALVLGSGFGGLVQALDVVVELSYGRCHGFLPSKVAGHAGKLLAGYLDDIPVVLLCGRSHYYEGHSMAAITFPIRVLAHCGIQVLLLTNAAGGINSRYRPGDFMCVIDHLNWMGVNPLRGTDGSGLTSFVDLSQAYDSRLVQLLLKAARKVRLRLHRGIYAAVSGPCYETPAEIRALARLGADAVGMSTVPEAIVARQCGIRVAAVSCITNLAAGRSAKPMTHGEVLVAGERAGKKANRLIRAFVRLVGSGE